MCCLASNTVTVIRLARRQENQPKLHFYIKTYVQQYVEQPRKAGVDARQTSVY